MNALDKLREVASSLKRQGIPDPAKEAETLVTETIPINRSQLYAGTVEVSGQMSLLIDSLAARRVRGEPLHYIIGHVQFYGLRIAVGPGVLIPRPETELLVDEAIRKISEKSEGSPLRILDLCTGSGCIALALAKHFPQAMVYGIDKSRRALSYASRNAFENNARNIVFINGDLFQPIGTVRFTCIISNPPYVRRSEIQGLQREIREHEPLEALDGGEEGLDFYRLILKGGLHFLDSDGVVILEIGFDQRDALEHIAASEGFRDIRFVKDYAGIWRIFCATAPGATTHSDIVRGAMGAGR